MQTKKEKRVDSYWNASELVDSSIRELCTANPLSCYAVNATLPEPPPYPRGHVGGLLLRLGEWSLGERFASLSLRLRHSRRLAALRWQRQRPRRRQRLRNCLRRELFLFAFRNGISEKSGR